MVHDRGSIKWTSMMLPEHAELLKAMWAEDNRKERPILDEQEKERINELLMLAFENQERITVGVFRGGYIYNYAGIIKKVEGINQQISLYNENEKMASIPIRDIVYAR